MANQAKVKLYDQLIEEGHVELVDISNEDETTPFSYLYPHNAIKEELGDEKIGINKVWAFEEQTKGFQRSEVGIRGEGMVKKLILLETTWKQARNESFKVNEMEQLY